MSNTIQNKINLLLRSEKALLKLELRKRSKQIVLNTIALLALFITLVMVNISVYFYLSTFLSSALAALILALINLFISALFFIIASKQECAPEAEAILDVRDFAWSQILEDVQEFKHEASEVKQTVKHINSGINGVLKRDVMSLGQLIPIIKILLENLKPKHNKEDKQAETSTEKN